MADPHNHDFIYGMLRDAIRKIDDLADKVDERLDRVVEKQEENHKELQERVADKLDALSARVDEQDKQLQKHSHYFQLFIFLFTGGIATVSGWFSWLGGVFGGHK